MDERINLKHCIYIRMHFVCPLHPLFLFLTTNSVFSLNIFPLLHSNLVPRVSSNHPCQKRETLGTMLLPLFPPAPLLFHVTTRRLRSHNHACTVGQLRKKAHSFEVIELVIKLTEIAIFDLEIFAFYSGADILKIQGC